jgi:hypothetical protein
MLDTQVKSKNSLFRKGAWAVVPLFFALQACGAEPLSEIPSEADVAPEDVQAINEALGSRPICEDCVKLCAPLRNNLLNKLCLYKCRQVCVTKCEACKAKCTWLRGNARRDCLNKCDRTDCKPPTGGTGGSAGTGGRGGTGGTTAGTGGAGTGGRGGTGGSTAGTGGSTAGTGGRGGTGGSTAGTGGSTAGTGGSTAGTGGSTAGTGGSTAGTGGSTAGTGGSTAGTGGTTAGTGGSTAGTGGATGGTGGSTAGTGGTPGCASSGEAACCECEAADSICNPRVAACFDATDNTAGGAAKAQLCAELVGCIRRTECASAENGSDACLCGTVSTDVCLAGSFAQAGGSCKNEIAAAAESSVIADIAQRFVDPDFAVGRAMRLITCDRARCSEQCTF